MVNENTFTELNEAYKMGSQIADYPNSLARRNDFIVKRQYVALVTYSVVNGDTPLPSILLP